MLILTHHLDPQISYFTPRIQAFLHALDDLLRGGFNGDNAKVSALFRIVERMLKLIGPLLSKSQTRRVSFKTGKTKILLVSFIHPLH